MKIEKKDCICDTAMKFRLDGYLEVSLSGRDHFPGFHLSAIRNEIILPFNSVLGFFLSRLRSRLPRYWHVTYELPYLTTKKFGIT